MQIQSQNVALGTNLGSHNKHDYLRKLSKPCEKGIIGNLSYLKQL